jgi:hypothetical protein
LLLKNPFSIEHIEQFETLLHPLEIDDISCQPTSWIESYKERRLRLPKVSQISYNIEWTKIRTKFSHLKHYKFSLTSTNLSFD